MPLLALALQLRLDDRAILAVREQLLELFARAIVETLWAFTLVRRFVDGPIFVRHHIGDRAITQPTAALFQRRRGRDRPGTRGAEAEQTQRRRDAERCESAR